MACDTPTAHRAALSVRGAARVYGVSRDRIARAIRSGELRASRLGERRYLILRRHAEEWIESHGVAPATPEAAREGLVERVIARLHAAESR